MSNDLWWRSLSYHASGREVVSGLPPLLARTLLTYKRQPGAISLLLVAPPGAPIDLGTKYTCTWYMIDPVEAPYKWSIIRPSPISQHMMVHSYSNLATDAGTSTSLQYQIGLQNSVACHMLVTQSLFNLEILGVGPVPQKKDWRLWNSGPTGPKDCLPAQTRTVVAGPGPRPGRQRNGGGLLFSCWHLLGDDSTWRIMTAHNKEDRQHFGG